MIQELQSSHLKIVRGYSFAKLIGTNCCFYWLDESANWLPQVQDAVRESVLRDLKDWFANIKQGAPRIGKLALGLTTIRQEKAQEILMTKAATADPQNRTQSMDLIMTEELDGIIFYFKLCSSF